MKYDYTEEFMKVLLENVSHLLMLPHYRTDKEFKVVTQLFNAMNPINFQKPTEMELWQYIKLVETLKPVSADDKKAVRTAREDLYYLLNLKG